MYKWCFPGPLGAIGTGLLEDDGISKKQNEILCVCTSVSERAGEIVRRER